jgi:stage V sporulation protein D (sporulation-specific penicillin-binding protein)
MGQEIAVTPIQLATAFCALVNGGQRVRPHVVAALLDRNYDLLEDRRPPQPQKQAVNPAVSSIMRGILGKVVQEGTGRRCRLEQWQVIGKTGTAQVPYENRRGYEPNAYLGSFMAAAPQHDPQVVALIMIRRPLRRIGYYGSQVAAPGVRAVLAETLPYLNVPPDSEVLPQDSDGVSLAAERRP